MSLINQMLRDLETRRADGSEKLSLPNEVRPLPAAADGLSWLKPLLAIFVVILVIAAVGWGVVVLTAPAAKTEAAASPQLPTHHESTLRLDSDLTAAHVQAVSPTRSHPPVVVASHAEASLPTRTVPSPAQDMEPKAQIEKRPPVTDHEGSPMQRAREQLNAGQRDVAEATLKQALAGNPGHVAARQMLFGLMMEERRGDDALALLKDGLAAHPEQTQWASNVARLQVDRGDIAGAWETLQLGLPAASGQGEYQAFCGTVLTRLKRYGEAVEHYQAALRTNPSEGRWWVGMALAFEADGKAPESREALARAQATGKLPPELAAYVDSKLKQQ